MTQNRGSQQKTATKKPCPQCGKGIKIDNMESHMDKKCPKRATQQRKKLHTKPAANSETDVVFGGKKDWQREEIIPQRPPKQLWEIESLS